ncbi:MAG: DUF2142 domain-containing protein [Lachnospiraceae bacterium]|nr:DUF2142 domain-containing protein [Lachnospiraceae bacterium]
MNMFANISKDKICEFVKKYGIMFSGMLIMYIIFLRHIINNPVSFIKGVNVFVAFIAFLLIVLIGVGSIYFEKKLHKLFLLIYAILGIMYFFAYPINSVPDEDHHFYRAYEISEGHMLSDIKSGIGGRELPKGLELWLDTHTVTLQESWSTLDIKLSDERTWYVFWNTSLYAPVSYVPQSLGIFVARIFTDSVAIMFLMGRLFNLVAVGLITYFAIKYIPVGKKMIIMITLLPMNMQEAISLAPDAMVTALTMAFIAFVLYLRYTQESVMSKKQLVLLYIMAIAISLYKIVYIPFCILPFLIPIERFGGKKQFISHAVCMGILVVVAGLGWLAFAGRYLLDIEGGKNSDDQIIYILSDLPNYFKIMFATIKKYGSFYFYTMFGQQLSYYNIFISKGYIILLVILLMGGVFSEEKVPVKFKGVSTLFALIVTAIFLLIMTSLYVQWTDYKNQLIEGVQGRYFIPLLLPMFLLIRSLIPFSLKEIFAFRNIILPIVIIDFIVVISLLGKFIGKGDLEKWVKYEEGWRYCNIQQETYLTNTWRQIAGDWYYFGEDGFALSDEWLEQDGEKYYFADGCLLVTGWQLIDEEWYYFNSNGTAYSGWLESDGALYYCEEGKMWYDCMTPDGYMLDEEGKRIQE